MNERKRVAVNEEALMQIMAANKETYLTDDIVKPLNKEPDIEPITASEPTKVENPNSEIDFVKGQKKRKNQKLDFSELFLKERVVKNRKPIYISVETYDIIQSYLKYIGDVSFIAYVDNILLQHIEEHKDTITELYSEKVSKPF
jgi:hypothetical protein